MPARSTARCCAVSLARIAPRLLLACAGSRPRSASLAPSSTITTRGFSASAQSSRASPPAVVSPETPPSCTSASMPESFRAFWSWGTKPCPGGRPKPAVRLSPSARILTGAASAEATWTITPSNIICARRKRRERGVGVGMATDSRGDGTMIRLSGIALKLASAAGEVNILRGLDLEVAAGESVGIVGPSGSGKSTMTMIIAGLERPSAGRVEVAGEDLTALDEDALARFRRARIGIVFQAFHLIPTMTALENVAVPLEFAGRSDAFERASSALAAVGLDHRLTHYPGQLSGGEQQRVALARAFVVEPLLRLADEPTGNLDGETGRQVIELMFELAARRGTTLMLITHDPALAGRCRRLVRLLDGRVVAS